MSSKHTDNQTAYLIEQSNKFKALDTTDKATVRALPISERAACILQLAAKRKPIKPINTLFLSVGRDVVSLWDSAEDRKHGALRGEIVVNLALTAEQQEFLAIARRAATVDVKGGE